MQVGHDDGRDGEHEGGEDLLRVIIDTTVGKRDAGTEERHPCGPLDLHHKATHGEDHGQDVHVVRTGILGPTDRHLEPVWVIGWKFVSTQITSARRR